jgi:23S rRNA pseudouridine2605 synthase
MPSTAIVRRYRARAHGRTTQATLDTLKAGATVEGVRYGPIEAKLDKAKEGPQGANLWITVTLHEGKNREVRRVLESIGLKVNRLIRLAYGPFALGTLGVGEIEEVGPRVIREQLAEHIDPENLPTGERPQWKSPRKSASRRAQEQAKVEADLAPPKAPKEKPAYKAGWAKPKRKLNPHLQARSAAKSGAAKGKAGARPDAPSRPGIVDRPAGFKPGGKGRPGGAKASGSAKAGGPAAGPRGPRPSASPPRSSGARRPGPPRSGGRGPRG